MFPFLLQHASYRGRKIGLPSHRMGLFRIPSRRLVNFCRHGPLVFFSCFAFSDGHPQK